MYSLIFPLSNLVGGGVAFIGMVFSLPFLPIAWVGGLLAVNGAHDENAYLIGAALTVMLQVLIIFTLLNTLRGKQGQ